MATFCNKSFTDLLLLHWNQWEILIITILPHAPVDSFEELLQYSWQELAANIVIVIERTETNLLHIWTNPCMKIQIRQGAIPLTRTAFFPFLVYQSLYFQWFCTEVSSG